MIKKYFSIAIFSLLVVTSVPSFAEEAEVQTDTYKLLNLFGDVFERVRKDYVEEIPDRKIIEQAINGMLTALDPHSSYLDADSFKDMQVQTTGQFGGLGIEVTMENGWVKVISPMDDTPAAKAGLQPGDFVTHIDGSQVMGMTLIEAVGKMRGKPGTKVKLTIRRKGDAPFDVTMNRDIIKILSVRSRVERENMGYIRVTSFNESTDKAVTDAIKSIEKQVGDKLVGYVIDLRNNPGGLLDQAVSVADIFLDKGEIVSTRARKEKDTQRYNATEGDLAKGLPLVVIINDGSASASEIVAGALQDHKRAIVVGIKSFGKGSVQTIIPMSGNGAIRLTTARYYTPSGRSIQAKGIEPDIEVRPAEIKLLDSFPERSEAELYNALINNEDKKADDKKSAKDSNQEDEERKKDYQLDRALDLLKGLSIYSSKN